MTGERGPAVCYTDVDCRPRPEGRGKEWLIMQKRTVGLALLALVVLAMFGLRTATEAQSPRGRGTLTALDYEEIRQLYGRYAIGIDTGNADMFSNVFTTDATFETPGRTIQGRKQLAELASKQGGETGPTNVSHVAVNVIIDPSAEGATGTSNYLRVKLGQKGEPSALISGGLYRDTFVKTPEGWRIRKRTIQQVHSIPPARTQ
jgi:hypothetical protein